MKRTIRKRDWSAEQVVSLVQRDLAGAVLTARRIVQSLTKHHLPFHREAIARLATSPAMEDAVNQQLGAYKQRKSEAGGDRKCKSAWTTATGGFSPR